VNAATADALRGTLRLLRLDAGRWGRIGPDSLWSAMAVVVITAFLMALVRFGGLVGDAPRAFLRLMLVTVWGWIALSAAVAVAPRVAHQPASWHLRTTLAVVGLSHVPMLVVAIVTLVFGGMMELLGPGRFVAVFAIAAWLPASVIVGVSVTTDTPLSRATAIVVVPYALWLALVARHVLGQVEHLL
jgi:hypothetical protein